MKIYKNFYGDIFFKIKNDKDFIDILDSIEKIPKRYLYFFSEVKLEDYYLNYLGDMVIFQIEKTTENKTFSNFKLNNDLIYEFIDLSKKSIIPFTIHDLITFYKKDYIIRYLKYGEKLLAFYIMKDNIVEFIFYSVDSINLILQTLNDVSSFIKEKYYYINAYTNQKTLFKCLNESKRSITKKFFLYRMNSFGIYLTSPMVNDAGKLIEFYEKVFKNSKTLATQLNEFDKTTKDFKNIIELSKKNFGLRILIAKYKDRIIGNSDIYWNINRARLERTAKLGISVLEEFRNMGIATTMLNNHLLWCLENPKIHRLELEVFSNNENAINLYKKIGFQEEGARKEAAYIDGKYYDILFMGIITEPELYFST
jgi:RimJ/RimL family protein N-acetyltransferase